MHPKTVNWGLHTNVPLVRAMPLWGYNRACPFWIHGRGYKRPAFSFGVDNFQCFI
jgi:hypothetical protein